MSDYGQISEFFRENIERTYLTEIKDRVLQEKHKYMSMLQNRAAIDDNFIMLIGKSEKPSNFSKDKKTQGVNSGRMSEPDIFTSKTRGKSRTTSRALSGSGIGGFLLNDLDDDPENTEDQD